MLISGQAGTGKSFVVSHILKSLRSKGLKVLVTCAGGISCSVYEESVRSRTVHSQYALQTADMPSEMATLIGCSVQWEPLKLPFTLPERENLSATVGFGC